MGTKNNPGAYDCHAKAEPDEPMYVLLGRDHLAPELVRAWAWEYLRNGGRDAAKAQEALDCAAAMEKWRHEHVSPKPPGRGQDWCAICDQPIRGGTVVGVGDGSGDGRDGRFAHVECARAKSPPEGG